MDYRCGPWMRARVGRGHFGMMHVMLNGLGRRCMFIVQFVQLRLDYTNCLGCLCNNYCVFSLNLISNITLRCRSFFLSLYHYTFEITSPMQPRISFYNPIFPSTFVAHRVSASGERHILRTIASLTFYITPNATQDIYIYVCLILSSHTFVLFSLNFCYISRFRECSLVSPICLVSLL